MKSDGTPLHLVLVGKTGVGKSSVGNSILRRPAFNSGMDTGSITSDISVEKYNVGGRSVSVVDTPGFADTELSSTSSIIKQSLETVDKVMEASSAGIDAFLLVVRFGTRFTGEDKHCVDLLKANFGAEMLQKYCILIVTCGDLFKTQATRSNESFDDWVKKQTGNFQELVSECQYRYVLFDNMTDDEGAKEEQVRILLNKVDELKSDSTSTRYTVANYAKSSVDRLKLEVSMDEPTITSDTMNTVASISEELGRIIRSDAESQVESLQTLVKKCQDVESNLDILDKGTGALSKPMNLISSVKTTVINQLLAKQTTVEETRRLEKEAELLKQAAGETLRKQREELNRRAAEELLIRQEEVDKLTRQREEEEKASRERQQALEAEIERNKLEMARQELALREAQRQRPHPVVREFNKFGRTVRRFFR